MNYSIEGLGLKLNTREDIEPYLKQIEPNISQLEEIHLCGNTIGVGAAQALAEVLDRASNIKVHLIFCLFGRVPIVVKSKGRRFR
jgi:Ran GTPase-activating protein 1